MLIVLAIHFLASQGTQALPIRADRAVDQSMPALCNDIRYCRTIWNIIWSCLVTIFGCTWVAVHPNIPNAEEKWSTTALRRLQLMVMALIAPEFIILWAMRQCFAACSLVKRHKKHQWTQTHGFFAIMGGFVLFDNNGPVRTLDPDELQSLAQDGDIDFPCITENEIRDKSKGDVLSKGLVVIQTGWFILQCIARRIEGLPLTELELVTLAFAALNFVTYGLWWYKPLDVQCPVRVPKKRQKGESEGGKRAGENSESAYDEKSREENGGRATDAMPVLGMLITTIRYAIWGVIAAVRNTPEAMGKAIGAIQDAIKRSVEYVRKHRWRTFWNGVKAVFEYGILVPLLESGVMVLFYGIWVPLIPFGLMGFGDDEDVKVGTMFYAGDSGVTWSRSMAGLVIATMFGAIHCVAWSFQFPSLVEQLLWRIASLSITCLPMVLLFTMLKITLLNKRVIFEGKLETVGGLIIAIIVILFPILYILSRITLLVIALMSLRSLPPGAYEVVHWTIFIPHV